MAEMEQLDAVLAQWRDATAPLDSKAGVDAALFSSSSARRSERALATRADAAISAAAAAVSAAPSDKRCRPWSHDDFLARAASFSIATWFAKPDVISVFACARHGWVNTARPDELFCACCEQYLCFRIDPKLSEQGAQRVASAFAAQLASGHSALCPWRDNPSPASFATLPVASLDQVREALVKRVEQLLAACATDRALVPALAALRVRPDALARVLQQSGVADGAAGESAAAASVALSRRLLAEFETLIVTSDSTSVSNPIGNSTTDARERTAACLLHVAVLSACGWRLETSGESESERVARCETCNRRWRLASYSGADAEISTTGEAAGEADGDVDAEAEARAAKRRRTEAPVPEAEAVDVLAQHRWFCPWVSARKAEASHERGVMSDELARYGENDAKLWEFTLLPGWQQYAKALGLLGESAARGGESPAAATQGASKPELALESVRAVLGLPEW